MEELGGGTGMMGKSGMKGDMGGRGLGWRLRRVGGGGKGGGKGIEEVGVSISEGNGGMKGL